jgi:hypothetical protein
MRPLMGMSGLAVGDVAGLRETSSNATPDQIERLAEDRSGHFSTVFEVRVRILVVHDPFGRQPPQPMG